MPVHDFILSFCKKQNVIYDPGDYIEINPEIGLQKTYTCNICHLNDFTSFKEFSAHRRSTHDIFHCDLCSKFYGRNSHLWKHVNRLHKGHPSITCQLCYKTSASKYHLAQHFNKIHNAKPHRAKDFTRMNKNAYSREIGKVSRRDIELASKRQRIEGDRNAMNRNESRNEVNINEINLNETNRNEVSMNEKNRNEINKRKMNRNDFNINESKMNEFSSADFNKRVEANEDTEWKSDMNCLSVKNEPNHLENKDFNSTKNNCSNKNNLLTKTDYSDKNDHSIKMEYSDKTYYSTKADLSKIDLFNDDTPRKTHDSNNLLNDIKKRDKNHYFNNFHEPKKVKTIGNGFVSEDDFLNQKFQGFDFQSVKQSFLKQELLERNNALQSDSDEDNTEDSNENIGNPLPVFGNSLFDKSGNSHPVLGMFASDEASGKDDALAPKAIDATSNLYTNIITNYTPPQNEGEYKCPKCYKGFHKKNLLKKHKKNCRPRLQKDLLTRCKTCSRIFKDRQSLTKHLINYHSEYVCEICSEKV